MNLLKSAYATGPGGGGDLLEHKLLVKLAPQEVVDKLSLFRLVIQPNSLVLEYQIIVPPSLDRKSACASGHGGGWCAWFALTQSGLEIEQRVARCYFLVSGLLALFCCFYRLERMVNNATEMRDDTVQKSVSRELVGGCPHTCLAFSSARSCLIFASSAMSAAVSSSSSLSLGQSQHSWS